MASPIYVAKVQVFSDCTKYLLYERTRHKSWGKEYKFMCVCGIVLLSTHWENEKMTVLLWLGYLACNNGISGDVPFCPVGYFHLE